MWTQFVEHQSYTGAQQEQLLEELYRQMYKVAYAIVRNHTDAMDVVQDAWLKILMRIDDLRDRNKLISWAKAIAANTALNLLKRRNLRAFQPFTEGIDHAVAAAVANREASTVEVVLIRRVLIGCLEMLDVETRQILFYKYFRDWKDKEIARKMDMPLGTVKARIHRGKARLKTVLKDVY